jgi:hypothetical protein
MGGSFDFRFGIADLGLKKKRFGDWGMGRDENRFKVSGFPPEADQDESRAHRA